MESSCLICGHPLQTSIDSLIQAQEDPADLADDDFLESVLVRVNRIIEGVYGENVLRVDEKTLRIHAFRHQLVTGEGQIVVRDDARLVIVDNKPFPVPTLQQAIAAIMSLGLDNLRKNPESVQVHHLLTAMKLADQIGMKLDEKELEDLLQEKLREPELEEDEAPLLPPRMVEVSYG